MSEFTLEKYIASQTRLARRKILDLLNAGLILVNGQVMTNLHEPIYPARDRVMVDGVTVKLPFDYVYYKYNKPKGIICTMHDPSGRPCLGTTLRNLPESVVSVGRLDRETTGLLLLTNDGEFVNRIAHPRYDLPKTYRVSLNKAYHPRDITKLKTGFFLEDGPVRFSHVSPVSRTSMDVTLSEGRNRIVRRAFESLGYSVKSLHRASIGTITLGDLMPGESKALTKKEIQELMTYDKDRDENRH